MITKNKFWINIVKELKEVERSKAITEEIMKRIKQTPQSEDEL